MSERILTICAGCDSEWLDDDCTCTCETGDANYESWTTGREVELRARALLPLFRWRTAETPSDGLHLVAQTGEQLDAALSKLIVAVVATVGDDGKYPSMPEVLLYEGAASGKQTP